MDTLTALRELQLAHDGLRAAEKGLSAFPPEMANLNLSIQAKEKRISIIDSDIANAAAKLEALEKQHQQAVKAEAYARQDLKESTNRGQYTILMRSLDEKERQLELAQRSLSEAEAALAAMESDKESLQSSKGEEKRQFDELHEIFMAENENIVVAKDRLTKQISELAGKLDQTTLSKFNMLLQRRQGRAVVAVESGTCTGCNIKLRSPLFYQLKAQGSVACETCQRILFLP